MDIKLEKTHGRLILCITSAKLVCRKMEGNFYNEEMDRKNVRISENGKTDIL